MSTSSSDDMELEFDKLDAQMRLFNAFKVGDIILVRRDKACISRSYQWLCRSFFRRHKGPKWSAIPSHALIVVAPGLYMESMPKIGVRLIKAEEYRPAQFQYFKVLRSPGAESFAEQLGDASTWHFGQSYNYKINLTWWRRKFRSHSYCSQLVCSVYEKAQKKLPGKPANLALPIDLGKLEFTPDWYDVTNDYLEADKLLEQGFSSSLFESHRWLTAYTMKHNYEMVDNQMLFHQVNLMTKMIDRRTRIRDALARVSPKAAQAYHRQFISSEDHSVDKHEPRRLLTPEKFIKMLLKHAAEFSGVPDIFAEAITWRKTDEKLQEKFEKGKDISAEFLYRQALAFGIAALNLALVLRDGDADNFERYRNQLLQATYIPTTLSNELNNIPSKVFEAMSALINEGDVLAKLWMCALFCFMELGVVSRSLLPGSTFADYRANPKIATLGQEWMKIFESLPPEKKQGVMNTRRRYLEDVLNRPNVDVESLENSTDSTAPNSISESKEASDDAETD